MKQNVVSFLIALALFFVVAAFAGHAQSRQLFAEDDLGGFQKVFVEQSTVRTTMMGPTDGNLIPMLEKADAVVIQLGKGGSIYGMQQTLNYLKANPEKIIVIDGPCYSACTMLLEARQTLWTNDAKFFFHSATDHWCEDGKEMSGMSFSGNEKMFNTFNAQTQLWILNSNAYNSEEFTKMPEVLVSVIYYGKHLDSQYMDEKIDANTPGVHETYAAPLRTCPQNIANQ